jgi:ketosteroid isomerase-like protein
MEVVRRVTDHFNHTGTFGPAELHDPEVTFTSRGDVGGRKRYSGLDGLADALAEFREVWVEISVQLAELLAPREDAVVAVMRFDLASRTGVRLEVDEGWAYWFREGRMVRIEQLGSRDAALEVVAARQ